MFSVSGCFSETYAEARANVVAEKFPSLRIGRILHPSPASPAANRDWAGTATKQLIELGVWPDQD